jgi:signal transduction histidine kinase
MTDNFAVPDPEVALEDRQLEKLQETLAQLRDEVANVRASRERLVHAADADRREIERALHAGVQQQLVALAVNLQLAGPLLDSDPAAASALLEEMGRDVQQALDEAARLAQLIYPTQLEAGGLAAALRSAAVSAGVSASVDVVAGSSYAPDVARTLYLCWLEALEHAGAEAAPTITVRVQEGALVFEVVAGAALSDARLEWLRDRVEALGGQLTPVTGPGRISGSFSLAR